MFWAKEVACARALGQERAMMSEEIKHVPCGQRVLEQGKE